MQQQKSALNMRVNETNKNNIGNDHGKNPKNPIAQSTVKQ